MAGSEAPHGNVQAVPVLLPVQDRTYSVGRHRHEPAHSGS